MDMNPKPKFTEGPWETLPTIEGKAYIRIRGTALGRRFKIANVIKGDRSRCSDPASIKYNEAIAAEDAANALLIEKAPELLKLLIQYRTQVPAIYQPKAAINEVDGLLQLLTTPKDFT